MTAKVAMVVLLALDQALPLSYRAARPLCQPQPQRCRRRDLRLQGELRLFEGEVRLPHEALDPGGLSAYPIQTRGQGLPLLLPRAIVDGRARCGAVVEALQRLGETSLDVPEHTVPVG